MEKNEIISLIILITSCVSLTFAIINMILIITVPQNFEYTKYFWIIYTIMVLQGG
ncbi:MAG: hypothetical protein ACTSRG_09820 [Candidatus Helarchaeota archaeon]